MKIYLLILFLSMVGITSAQYMQFNPSFSPYNNKVSTFQVDTSGNITFIPKKIGYSLNVGGAFTTGYGGGGIFSSYIAPEIQYNVSERFRVTGGVALINSYGIQQSGFPEVGYPGLTPMRANVYVSGQYLINNKLMLSGTVYKDFDLYAPANADPRYKSQGRQGMILDLNYRPVKNMQINAVIHINEGGYNPWSQPGMPGGFYGPCSSSPW